MGIAPKIVAIALAAWAAFPAFAAESFIIVDNQTGHVLASQQRDEKLPVASLTKVATAVVVLDWARLRNANLSALVTVNEQTIAAGGMNPVGLQPGDQMSVRDLIYCALLASDNVAAVALAEHVGASLPNQSGLDAAGNFVSHMNALARTLGMSRTRFLNPSGFDGYEDGATPYSTAEDLARLVRYAYNVPGFPFYVAQADRQVHIFRNGIDTPFELRNTNELLGRDGIDGVKTGRTRRAGDCLILSADRAPESTRDGEKVFITPRRIIVVLLRSPDRFGEGAAMIQRGWGLYDAWASGGRKSSKSQSL